MKGLLFLLSISVLLIGGWYLATSREALEAESTADPPNSAFSQPESIDDRSTFGLPGETVRNAGNNDEVDSESAAKEARDCIADVRYVANDDGTVAEIDSCDPATSNEPHPYEYYDDIALRELSYSDAAAAEILGRRLAQFDSQESLRLYVRAAALRGGDPDTLLKYAEEYPTPERVNDMPVLETVRIKYVLSKAASQIGDRSGELESRTEDVVEAFPNAEDVIVRFDNEARAILEQMRDIEIEITGSSSIVLPARP